MEEIKVGEYVRTKEGCIFQIVGQCKRVDHTLYDTDNFGICSSTVLKEITKKHSPNIIELIEEGDYVNGEKVIEVRKQNEQIYLMTSYVPQKYIKEDIKSIVTKEQFNQMKYIVGE